MKPTRLALALRLYIAANQIEQRLLAKEWDCSESTVTRFLAGQAMPEAKTMMRILAWMIEESSKPLFHGL